MWLVQQKVAPAATCTERTYEEIVQVVNGRALVNTQSALNFLHTCGYAVVKVLPPLETMMRRNPGHVINLGREGLGPLAGRTTAELDELEAELKETGRVAELQGPVEVIVIDEPKPGLTEVELREMLAFAEARIAGQAEELVRRQDAFERLQSTEEQLKAALVEKEQLAADHTQLQAMFQEVLVSREQLLEQLATPATSEPMDATGEPEKPADPDPVPATEAKPAKQSGSRKPKSETEG